MKFTMLLLLGLLFACKPQEKNLIDSNLPSASAYQPNPDEVVMQVRSAGEDNKVEILRQIRAGFGIKSRLKPGEIITLTSDKALPEGDFYCSAERKISPDGDTYILKTFLNE